MKKESFERKSFEEKKALKEKKDLQDVLKKGYFSVDVPYWQCNVAR